MLLLDTNVLSELMQQKPDQQVLSWIDDQSSHEIWISSITVFEGQYGIEIMSDGVRKHRLQAQFERLIVEDFENRVLYFDARAAQEAASLAAKRRAVGRPVDIRDTYIAGIAIAHSATLVTGNTRHFDDVSVPVLNPWKMR